MKVFLVLVGSSVYAVADTRNEELPIAIVKVPREKKTKKPVMTLNDFLTMAAQHPVFGQVKSWDPLWQSANDT